MRNKTMSIRTLVPSAIAIALFVHTPISSAAEPAAAAAPASRTPGVPYFPQREAFYGDLHLHTIYSFDAYLLFGAKIDPDAAYRFAKGESVNFLGHDIHRVSPPLDFMAVTDHSENIGVFNTAEDPDSELSKTELGQTVRREGIRSFWEIAKYQLNGKPLPIDTQAIASSAWQREMEAANRNYQPGKFTTFIAYEWTSGPDQQNLHRNVIFRGDHAPNPFTSVDSRRPEDLWTWLDSQRTQGNEALAIPHNGNASNGLMYDWVDSDGRPIDQAYAEKRAANEPLTEISQNKGQSETVPALSPNDEFASFELYEHLLAAPERKSKPEGSYVRDALGRGIEIATHTNGVNPYKYGIVGASDFHNGLSDSAESAYVGTIGAADPNNLPDIDGFAKRFDEFRRSNPSYKAPANADENASAYDIYENGSGNLTGVWAEQNSRESIYDAMRRKETFATSGTRLKLRFFGGWKLQDALLKRPEWVKQAYAQGVPMGADLPARPAKSGAPEFLLWAVKDPAGANLDRLQIVKVWLRDGHHVEQVFDAALSGGRKVDPATGKAPAVGNTVDLKSATWQNSIGATQLSTVWHDPQFDPHAAAVYYLRVLEIPTPRWSTLLAARRGQPLPDSVPATIQERGWSSPIWYTPRP
jgi:hypothetical protein